MTETFIESKFLQNNITPGSRSDQTIVIEQQVTALLMLYIGGSVTWFNRKHKVYNM